MKIKENIEVHLSQPFSHMLLRLVSSSATSFIVYILLITA